MSGAWEKINKIIGDVRLLETTPIQAVNQIEDVLIEAAIKEAPLYPQGDRLSVREWLGLCLCTLALGMILGWSMRIYATNDRYLTGLAEQHESAAKYYSERTDQLIHANNKGAKTP